MEPWRQEGDPGDGVRRHWGGTGAVKMGWHLPLSVSCVNPKISPFNDRTNLTTRVLIYAPFYDRKPEACGGENGLK